MSRYRYEIDENNALRIWDTQIPNEENAPVLFQPDWPDGTPWGSKEEVEAWALLYIESSENPDSEFVPGVTPSEPQKPRVTPEVGTSDTPTE